MEIKESIFTDEQIEKEYMYIQGYVQALGDNGIEANFPVLLVRHIEKTYGIRMNSVSVLQPGFKMTTTTSI